MNYKTFCKSLCEGHINDNNVADNEQQDKLLYYWRVSQRLPISTETKHQLTIKGESE